MIKDVNTQQATQRLGALHREKLSDSGERISGALLTSKAPPLLPRSPDYRNKHREVI